MGVFSRWFAPARKPEGPFVEFPDGVLKSAREALEAGLRVYRNEGAGRRATLSWQGQGGRADSYHIVDLELAGEVVSFREAKIDLERACAVEGVAFDALRGSAGTELNIASLSEAEAAKLIEALLARHAGMKPFEDSHDFCVGFEYER